MVVECLSQLYEALGSIPSTAKKKEVVFDGMDLFLYCACLSYNLFILRILYIYTVKQ